MQVPSYCRPAAFKLFCSSLENIESSRGLLRAAFAISLHERPTADLSATEAILENLSSTVKSRVQSLHADAVLAHLHDVLFDVYALRGNVDDYYNPANSYLPDVLQTRQGLPIALVLIYKCVAEPLGLRVYGINAPGHFLAEVEIPGRTATNPMFVDPFFGGVLLTPAEAHLRIRQTTGLVPAPSPKPLARASHKQWLARMLINLQAAFSFSGQDRSVLAMQEFFAQLDG